MGEEDGGPYDESAWEGVPIPHLKGFELEGEVGKSEHTVPMTTLCIFVDPVDGTREFVEGRLQSVQTLIGISYMGRSIAGAVGIPFPEGQISNPPSVVYALVGAGVGRHGFQPPALELEDQEGWSVTTGDSKVDKVINAAVAVAQPPRRVIMGAVSSRARSPAQSMLSRRGPSAQCVFACVHLHAFACLPSMGDGVSPSSPPLTRAILSCASACRRETRSCRCPKGGLMLRL